ncbi:C-type cytochrome [Planctomycetales bacterium 10988]|nr:C-type cytochrome [Planctomycetales bacterium 10988]
MKRRLPLWLILAFFSLSQMPSIADELAKSPATTEDETLVTHPPLEVSQGERIAFLGGSQAERMGLYGHFETELLLRFPEKELVIRNFGWPADEVGNRQRPRDYTKLGDPLELFSADTYLCFFGSNESYAGSEAVELFQKDYGKLLDQIAERYPRQNGEAPRFILISPAAFESSGERFLPEGTEENKNLALYTEAIAELAQERSLPFVDLFNPTLSLFSQEEGLQYTINGCHLNEAGDREMGQLLNVALLGKTDADTFDQERFEQLREVVIDKAWLHQQDYRMVNGWYVYGGRRTWDTETFPREYQKLRAMVAVRDQYAWDIAQGKEVPPQPDDSETGELIVPETRFGDPRQNYSEAEELRYLTTQEQIDSFQTPDGFKVKLFADELDFPELANPAQLGFDNQGRLWVSCMPTYPQWRPGDPKPNDKLLIFEDTDGDGEADVCKTFYDKLHCPTGFEFWNGGVLVVDQPRLIWLKDTDGDDRADKVVQLIDGWATQDTHHTIGAFEYSHGGILKMLEGIAMSTTIETPWGPLRNSGTSGCYHLDPRTLEVRHTLTPGQANPWCNVFNPWGQGFVGDGTNGIQVWSSPLTTAPVRGRRGLNPIFDNEGMRPVVGNELLFTRQFPDSVQGQFIYACVINMNGFTRFTVGDDGAGYHGDRIADLLSSTDKHFRPVDPQIGPDGTIWFGDWSAALIGHMQYSQRDPNRDHSHGRIYRLIYEDKPLITPVTQYQKSIPELLEQFREYEPRTRYRVRRELRDRPTEEVLAAIEAWLSELDSNDEVYDRLLCEALWVQQAHHAVDVDLLQKALSASTPDARAAAVHVAAEAFRGKTESTVFPLLIAAANDQHPRVRLEALRALSYFPELQSVEAILSTLDLQNDYWLTYTMQHSLGALQPVWEPALKQGTLAVSDQAAKYLADYGVADKAGAKAQGILDTLLSETARSREKTRALQTLIGLKGDAKNGHEVYARTCRNCHKVGDEGFELGPALTDVGKRLKPEEIIESILDPNAKVDPKFASTQILTDEGIVHTGLIADESEDIVTLKVPDESGKEFKVIEIYKDSIEGMATIKQSSMPEGLAKSLAPLEFLDLLTYLRTLKN